MGAAFLKLLGGLLLVSLMGCTPQATPIAPMIVATPAEMLSATSEPFLRYAIAPDLMRWLPPSVRDLRLLIEPYTGTVNPELVDLVVAYGIYEGWQQSDQSHQVSLIINPNLAPLDEPAIRELFASALDSPGITAQIPISGVQSAVASPTTPPARIREQLANLGYPDGISFTIISADGSGAQVLIDSLAQSGFHAILQIRPYETLQDLFSSESSTAALVVTSENQVTSLTGWLAGALIYPLYKIPISYWSQSGISVDFLENGIPLPAR